MKLSKFKLTEMLRKLSDRETLSGKKGCRGERKIEVSVEDTDYYTIVENNALRIGREEIDGWYIRIKTSKN